MVQLTGGILGSQVDSPGVNMIATANLAKGVFVKADIDGVDGSVEIADAAGEGVMGVTLIDALAGESVRVQVLGVVKIVAGAAITRGDEVMTSAAGRAVTLATAASVSQGQALEAAALDGDTVTCFINASGSIPLV